MEHRKKYIFVTGASRGIGRGIALQLAREGYAVVCGYHHSEAEAMSLFQEISALNVPCFLVQGDLGDMAQCQQMMTQVLELVPHLDGLVLNGAVSTFGLLQDTTVEQWRELMDVNLHSCHSLLQVALPSMIAQGSGSIVTISSMWGQVGASYEVAYSTSKAGVIGLTKALALELAPMGLRVNSVSPGLIQTDMNSMLEEEDYQCFIEKIPLGRAGTVEEVAEVVCFLLSEKSSYLTGQILAVNGGQVV